MFNGVVPLRSHCLRSYATSTCTNAAAWLAGNTSNSTVLTPCHEQRACMGTPLVWVPDYRVPNYASAWLRARARTCIFMGYAIASTSDR